MRRINYRRFEQKGFKLVALKMMQVALNPIPYTLYLIPYTLHPTP
jgi:hypothetical protein